MSLTKQPAIQTCHVYVKKLAREMAGAAYEEAARDDAFYKAYPDQKEFIRKYWGVYVGEARNMLVTMLGMPSVSEHMKAEIFDIVVKDRSLQDPRLLGATAGHC